MNSNSNRDSSYTNALRSYFILTALTAPIASANESPNSQSDLRPIFLNNNVIISPSKKPIDLSNGRLRELSTYKDGWFEPHYKAAKQQTIEDAELFLYNFDFLKADRPFITLTSDGEINMLWKNDEFILDLGFFGDGNYVFFGQTKNNNHYEGENINVDIPLKDEILQYLSLKNDFIA